MADSACPRIKHSVAKLKYIVAGKGPPYCSRRRLAANNDDAMSVLIVSIGEEPERFQVVALLFTRRLVFAAQF
jgi:hypothetical protein